MGYSTANGDQKHVVLVVNFDPGEINVAHYSSILGEYLSLMIYPVNKKNLSFCYVEPNAINVLLANDISLFIQVPVAIKVLIIFGIKQWIKKRVDYCACFTIYFTTISPFKSINLVWKT